MRTFHVSKNSIYDQKPKNTLLKSRALCYLSYEEKTKKIWDALVYAWDEENHAFVHDISKNCS